MSKGEATRERIIDRAFLIAGRDGLEGLTIGALATELKLSKSGLFSHFGSKEELQVAVLDVASSRFTERVMLPAFKAPRGLPRLERIFEGWIDWMTDSKMPHPDQGQWHGRGDWHQDGGGPARQQPAYRPLDA